MLVRFIRIATCFTAIVAAYGAYALFAVPMLELSIQKPVAEAGGQGNIKPRIRSTRVVLDKLFAPGSWELDNPKILVTDYGMLIIKEKEFDPMDEGRMQLKPCTLILFSDSKKSRKEKAGRPIVIRAPKCVLDFGRKLDYARADFGQLVGAQLVGEVTIQSPPSKPGADDRIDITTSNVQIDEKQIWTPYDVSFRFGPHFGRGRDLVITIDDLDSSSQNDSGNKLIASGVQSLELIHVDQIQIQLAGEGLLSANSRPLTHQPRIEKRSSFIEITCDGPFIFDIKNQIASFEKNVSVVRHNPDVQSDQLKCQLLSILFHSPEENQEAQKSSASLSPRQLEATGRPVLFSAPSVGLFASGERLTLRIQKPEQNNESTADSTNPKRHILSLYSNAQIKLSGSGGFSADKIHLSFKENNRGDSTDPQNVSAANSPRRMAITPERLRALGNVQIDSPQLSGSMRELNMTFLAGGATTPSPGQAERNRQSLSPRLQNGGGEKPEKFNIACEEADIQVLVGDKVLVREVTLKGSVDLQQTQSAKNNDHLFRMSGDIVKITDGDTNNRKIDITGRLAEVSASGIVMKASNLHLAQGENRIWIEGAGEMTLPPQQNAPGGAPPNVRSFVLTWKRGMVFNGQTAHFEQDVETKGKFRSNKGEWFDLNVKGDLLDVEMESYVDFSNPKAAPTELKRLTYQGGRRRNVFLTNYSFDQQGRQVSFDQMQARNLTLDRQSGHLHAEGPGWASTVRRGDGQLAGRNPFSGNTASQKKKNELSYLLVQFQKEIRGDIGKSKVDFFDRVRTTYGPVASWDQTLQSDRLGDERILMTCRQLTVIDMSPANSKQSNLEMIAIGNTSVVNKGFTANAHRISYASEKDLLILEGDGRNDVRLWKEPRGQRPNLVARKILYSRKTGSIEVDGIRSIEHDRIIK